MYQSRASVAGSVPVLNQYYVVGMDSLILLNVTITEQNLKWQPQKLINPTPNIIVT